MLLNQSFHKFYPPSAELGEIRATSLVIGKLKDALVSLVVFQIVEFTGMVVFSIHDDGGLNICSVV